MEIDPPSPAINAYQSLEARLHDVFWATEGPPVELPLLRSFLEIHLGPSLEIGCGSGRLLYPLIEAGFSVEGLELSADMIQLCREHPTPATIHHGNMDQWQAPQRYASLLVPAFTLQLSQDPAAALKHFATMLQDRGMIYLSTFTPLAEILGDLPENTWYPDHQTLLPDGSLAVLHTLHRVDREQQLLERSHRYEIHDSSGQCLSSHESQQRIHWITREQLKRMLTAAGFEIVQQYADFKPSRKSLKQAQIISTIARRIG